MRVYLNGDKQQFLGEIDIHSKEINYMLGNGQILMITAMRDDKDVIEGFGVKTFTNRLTETSNTRTRLDGPSEDAVEKENPIIADEIVESEELPPTGGKTPYHLLSKIHKH